MHEVRKAIDALEKTQAGNMIRSLKRAYALLDEKEKDIDELAKRYWYLVRQGFEDELRYVPAALDLVDEALHETDPGKRQVAINRAMTVLKEANSTEARLRGWLKAALKYVT